MSWLTASCKVKRSGNIFGTDGFMVKAMNEIFSLHVHYMHRQPPEMLH